MKQLLFYGASISISFVNAEPCPDGEVWTPSSTEKYCMGSADAEEKGKQFFNYYENYTK